VLGAIAGDLIGSVYEYLGLKTVEFPLFTESSTFTDDSVMTLAVAAVLLDGGDYAARFREFGLRYPGRGYGGRFGMWLRDPDMGPYQSWGNGSAMRVSPVGWARDSAEEVLEQARRTAEPSHDHPEGVRGAEAVALGVYLARHGADKAEIKRRVTERTGYRFEGTLDEIRPRYAFDESCLRTVPESFLCFFESTDFESAVRLAISMGGDADTMACIAGALAEAHYGPVPESIATPVRARLPEEFVSLIDRFERIHPHRSR